MGHTPGIRPVQKVRGAGGGQVTEQARADMPGICGSELHVQQVWFLLFGRLGPRRGAACTHQS
eukprot:13145660-Alexandrium_andersonii.AAC.1